MAYKQCPRLMKFHIPETGKLEQWQEDICLYCIVKPMCWEHFFDDNDEGFVPPYLIQELEASQIPCPQCQATEEMDWLARKRIAEEIYLNNRLSTLTKNKDGAWQCFRCKYQIKKRRKK